jgi:hypothetical protein
VDLRQRRHLHDARDYLRAKVGSVSITPEKLDEIDLLLLYAAVQCGVKGRLARRPDLLAALKRAGAPVDEETPGGRARELARQILADRLKDEKQDDS